MLYNSNIDPLDPMASYLFDEHNRFRIDSFLEVGTKCFHYPGLKGDENTILVYSALLSIRDDSIYEDFKSKPTNMWIRDVCFYQISRIANLLRMRTDTVQRSIERLKELKLISVVSNAYQSTGIKINEDLRYITSEVKDIIKIYNRIFFYPMITKEMVMLYSYYLYFSEILTYQKYSRISYYRVTKAIGYSRKRIIRILKEMEQIGLATLVEYSNFKAVVLATDFSKRQKEESVYVIQEHEQDIEEFLHGPQVQLAPEIEDEIEASLQNALKNYETWRPKNPDDPDPFDFEFRGYPCICIDAKNLTPSQFRDPNLVQFAASLAEAMDREHITDWSISIQSTESVDWQN